MAHPRKTIRDAVKTALDSATAAGTKVYDTRKVPDRVEDLPMISIYALDERVDAESQLTAPRELTRTLSLAIECWVAETAAVSAADAADALAEEIETAMHADPYLGGAAGDSILTDTDVTIEPIGDRMVGLLELTYAVTYRTLAPEAPTDLDDFLTVEATHNLGGDVHEDDQAVDEFTVQEAP